MLKLYIIPGACSLAPHAALREMKIPFELVFVDPATKQGSDGDDYLTVNPLGYVGAIRFTDGHTLTETSVMLEYLADMMPDTQLAPPAGTWERIRFREWLSFLSCELNCTMSPLFRAIPDEAKEVIRSRLFKRFDYLEGLLGRQDFLMGGVFGIADIYLFTVLLWPPRVGIELAAWPRLLAFRERIGERPSIREACAAEGLRPAEAVAG